MQVVVELIHGISKRAARIGHALSFLAVLMLTISSFPHHAHSEDGSEQSHFGQFCETLGSAESTSDDNDRTQSPHGDCIHHFDPMVRAPLPQRLGEPHTDMVAVVDVARQLRLTSDPPPPRFPS